jgi:hypothetical protein
MNFVITAQQQLKKIDNSKIFQGIVIAVILLSALLIALKLITYRLMLLLSYYC